MKVHPNRPSHPGHPSHPHGNHVESHGGLDHLDDFNNCTKRSWGGERVRRIAAGDDHGFIDFDEELG